MIRLLAFLCLVILGASQSVKADQDRLTQIIEKGELTIGALYQQGHFQRRQDKNTGLDIELSDAFASALGVKLKVIPFSSANKLISALKSNQIDIASTPTLLLGIPNPTLKIGPVYSHVELTLISPKDSYPSTSLAEIKQPIAVTENSDLDKLLKRQSIEHSHLIWKTLPKFNAFDIATLVQENKFTHGLIRSEDANRLRDIFPTLVYTPLDLPPVPVTWLFNKQSTDSLTLATLEFFAREETQLLLEFHKQKSRQSEVVSAFFNSRDFIEAYYSKLPKFKTWFKSNAQHVDWKVLASIAYQMSNWHINPEQSIRYSDIMGFPLDFTKGNKFQSAPDFEAEIRQGARHLTSLYQQLPHRISPQEKVWFAVACYFLGFEHVERAREITVDSGGNPDMWIEVKPHLIKLESAHTQDPHRLGFAPGLDALQFVENVKKYTDIIRYLEEEEISKN